MLSAKMEDYLKAIYEITQREGEPVSTSSVAELLEVTPPTVTSMMEKLEERGLIEREKYSGAHLTREGETVALEVLRHHRLLETYLAEQLGYDWTEVHEEADRLEHHISEEFEQRVARLLGDRDPSELAYLKKVGIVPGTELSIEEVAPIGIVTVRVTAEDTVSVPDDIASSIQVRPLEEPEEDTNSLA
jgi:DtxR family Mn-dependent transcriptional regulator